MARFGVSPPGIAYALKQLKISGKKIFQHPKANQEAQQLFQAQIAHYHKTNQLIIYINESGFAHDMPRRAGYFFNGGIFLPWLVIFSLIPYKYYILSYRRG